MVSLRMSPFHLNGVDGDAVTNDDHWSIFFVTFWGLNWLSICNHCPPDWPRVGQSIRIIFYKTLIPFKNPSFLDIPPFALGVFYAYPSLAVLDGTKEPSRHIGFSL